MTPEQIQNTVELAISQGILFPWWSYILFIVLSGLASYLAVYLREKGKNLATKEDIGKITDDLFDAPGISLVVLAQSHDKLRLPARPIRVMFGIEFGARRLHVFLYLIYPRHLYRFLLFSGKFFSY